MLSKCVPQSSKEDMSLEGLLERGAWVTVVRLVHRKWQRGLVAWLGEAVCPVADCLAAHPHRYMHSGNRKSFLSAIEISRPLGTESLCLELLEGCSLGEKPLA